MHTSNKSTVPQVKSLLSIGNSVLRSGNYVKAIEYYLSALQKEPSFGKMIAGNMQIAKQKYRTERDKSERQRVAVCGWELSHNSAGRVYTLAKLYEMFADVEIIGSIFSGYGREIWEPIRNTTIPCHTFIVEDEDRFLDQAIALVTAHPYDIVHLSKPRAPNIFFGILYKLIWDAKVLIDIDDEELAFVGAETAISIEDYQKSSGKLPEMKGLDGKDWTRIAVGLAKEFDGITVSNPALQQRYGGEIIRHARDEKLYQPSAELKRKSREKFGIPQDKKVVLFFGTPNEHKGLLETADAIASLKREDMLFVIVGDFSDPQLKAKLLEKKGVDYVFISNQPFDTIPEVMAIADIFILLQDPDSPVSQFQVPAKLSDALGMGLVVVTSHSQSLTDIYIENSVIFTKQDSLFVTLSDLISEGNSVFENIKAASNSFFYNFLTISVNALIIKKLITYKPAVKYGNILNKNLLNLYFSPPYANSSLYLINEFQINYKKPSIIFSENIQKKLKISSLEDFTRIELAGKPVKFFKTFDYETEKIFLNLIEKNYQLLGSVIDNKMVSIVMPTFNRGKSIVQSVASVVKQTHQNWELIIIDDGSTDSTFDIVNNLIKSDSRIRILRNPRKGVSAARNIGLENANGQYIFYLDSDNQWTEPFLKTMLIYLEYSGSVSAYSGISVLDDDGSVTGYRGEPFNWDCCLDGNYVDLNAFCHKKNQYLELGGFDENLRRMVDWDLILRYTKSSKPCYAPFIGCHYLDSKKDSARISVAEPIAYRSIVQVKNKLSTVDPFVIAKHVRLKFAIKTPAPFEKRNEWGDFHFAESLKCSLEKLGHSVTIDFHGKWYERTVSADHVVIVLRGLTEYQPRLGQLNILWNISHPDQVSYEEYEKYDIVYIASLSYPVLLNTFLTKQVKPLLQCTDINRFKSPKSNLPKKNKLLFVGNSRNEYRVIVNQAITSGFDIDIYGTRWEQFIDKKYIVGENIDNKELSLYYSSYKFVLNDHWESMRDYGLISNRIFDVLSCGGVLVSDPIPSITRVFGDAVLQVEASNNLAEMINHPDTYNNLVRSGRDMPLFIASNHSFDIRAKTICNNVLENLNLPAAHNVVEKVSCVQGFISKVERLKIGILCQRGSNWPTSSGFIRLIAPLSTDYAQTKVELIYLNGVEDIALNDCKICIVQRVAIPCVEEVKHFLAKIQDINIKLFVDNDDAFSLLPDTHPEKEIYSKKDSALRLLMKNAEHVWFSTSNLMSIYLQDCKNSSVIENTLDPRLWRNYREKLSESESSDILQILYMGTATHDADFKMILPSLDRLHESHPGKFHLTIVGAVREPPKKAWLSILPPAKEAGNYPLFVRWFSKLTHFDLGLAPLVDDQFNSCKSDIKFLDYSSRSLPSLVSNVPPYQAAIDKRLAIGVNNSEDGWYFSIKEAIEHRHLLKDIALKANTYLWSERTSIKAAKKMIDLITLT